MAFEGTVEVYSDKFYINTETGEGIDRVLKKIDPLITKMAKKLYINDLSIEDKKQELVIIALEGIRNYQSDRGTKLSTFLHRHMFFKSVSRIGKVNQKRRNANYLKSADTKHGMSGAIELEIPFSELKLGRLSGEKDGNVDGFLDIYKPNDFFDSSSNDAYQYSSIDHKIEIERCLSRVSNKMGDPYSKIISKVFFDKRSIKDVSAELNLTKHKLMSLINDIKKQPEIAKYRSEHGN